MSKTETPADKARQAFSDAGATTFRCVDFDDGTSLEFWAVAPYWEFWQAAPEPRFLILQTLNNGGFELYFQYTKIVSIDESIAAALAFLSGKGEP